MSPHSRGDDVPSHCNQYILLMMTITIVVMVVIIFIIIIIIMLIIIMYLYFQGFRAMQDTEVNRSTLCISFCNSSL